MKIAHISGAILGLFLLVGVGRAELQPGDAAPNFRLQASDGHTYSLAAFKGKQAVVIAWFPKAFTGGCTKECESLKASGDAVREYKVAYFTASVDPVATNAEFAKSLDLDYPILSDPTGATAVAYGVADRPGDNARRWTIYIGADGKILHVDKSVSVGSHGDDIAAKLGELGVEKKSE